MRANLNGCRFVIAGLSILIFCGAGLPVWAVETTVKGQGDCLAAPADQTIDETAFTADALEKTEKQPAENPLARLAALRRTDTNVYFPIIALGAVIDAYNETHKATYREQNVRGDAAAQTAIMAWLAKELDLQIVYPFMDLTVEPQAVAAANGFGDVLTVIEYDDATPEYSVKPFIDPAADPATFVVPDPAQDVFMRQQLDFIRRARGNTALSGKAIMAWVIGPVTLVGRMIGEEEMAVRSVLEPEQFGLLLDYATRVIQRYVDALGDAGADAVCLLEPETILTNPAGFEEYAVPRINQIAQDIRARKMISIFHACGDTHMYFPAFASIAMDGFSLDRDIALSDFAALRPDAVMIGNYDNTVISREDTKTIVENSRSLLGRLSLIEEQGKCIPGTGCEIKTPVTIEQLRALEHGLKPVTVAMTNEHATSA